MKEKVNATRTESLMGHAAPIERTDSNDRPSGPPRLNLAGGKPSWKDREVTKGAAGDSSSDSSPAGPSSGDAPLCHGRSGRGEEDGRDGSPAQAPTSGDSLKPSGAAGKFVPPHLPNKQNGDGWEMKRDGLKVTVDIEMHCNTYGVMVLSLLLLLLPR